MRGGIFLLKAEPQEFWSYWRLVHANGGVECYGSLHHHLLILITTTTFSILLSSIASLSLSIATNFFLSTLHTYLTSESSVPIRSSTHILYPWLGAMSPFFEMVHCWLQTFRHEKPFIPVQLSVNTAIEEWAGIEGWRLSLRFQVMAMGKFCYLKRCFGKSKRTQSDARIHREDMCCFIVVLSKEFW